MAWCRLKADLGSIELFCSVWFLPRLKAKHLAAGDCAHYQEWFPSGGNLIWEGCVWRFVREVLLAGEESDEGATDLCCVVAEGALQAGVAGLKAIENCPLGD